jgi:hypothetical protein
MSYFLSGFILAVFFSSFSYAAPSTPDSRWNSNIPCEVTWTKLITGGYGFLDEKSQVMFVNEGRRTIQTVQAPSSPYYLKLEMLGPACSSGWCNSHLELTTWFFRGNPNQPGARLIQYSKSDVSAENQMSPAEAELVLKDSSLLNLELLQNIHDRKSKSMRTQAQEGIVPVGTPMSLAIQCQVQKN